jgi:uncharacterized membrane protein (DUF485 family)
VNIRYSKQDILNDPDFLELSSKRNSMSLVLTVIELAVYYGFIFLIAFGRDFLAKDLMPNVTVGIALGLGVIVLSCVLTGIYVRWANNKYDALVDKIKDKIGG